MDILQKTLLCSAVLSCSALSADNINWNEWQVYHHKDLTVQIAAKLTSQAPVPQVKGKLLKGVTLNIPANGVDLRQVLNVPAQPFYPAIMVKKVTLSADRVFKLGCGVDWWFEAYCNGNIIYSTLQAGGNVEFPITGDDNVMKLDLKKGENLIAIFLQSGGASFTTAIKLFPADHPYGGVSRRLEAAANTPVYSNTLRHGPWLTAPGLGKITVNFITNAPIGSAVEYRKKGSKRWQKKYHLRGAWQVLDQEMHRITLDDLQPGAEYEYRVVLIPSVKPLERLVQSTHSFKAFPADDQEEFSFFVTGDTQFGVNRRGSYINKWQKHITQADFQVHLGDLAAIFDDFELMLFGGYFNYLTPENYHGKPFVAIHGNHELRGREAARWFELLAPDMQKAYYSFRCGSAFFAVVDTGDEDTFEKMQQPRFKHQKEYMLRQYKYFQQAVNSPEYRSARYRIIMSHGGAYSHNPAKLGLMAHYLMEPFVEAAQADPARKIHLHLAGHIHRYRRSVPNSTALYSLSSIKAAPDSRVCDFTVLTCAGPNKVIDNQLSCTTVKVTPEKLEIRSFDEQNQCFDHFTIDEQGKVTPITGEVQNPQLKLYKF